MSYKAGMKSTKALEKIEAELSVRVTECREKGYQWIWLEVDDLDALLDLARQRMNSRRAAEINKEMAA